MGLLARNLWEKNLEIRRTLPYLSWPKSLQRRYYPAVKLGKEVTVFQNNMSILDVGGYSNHQFTFFKLRQWLKDEQAAYDSIGGESYLTKHNPDGNDKDKLHAMENELIEMVTESEPQPPTLEEAASIEKARSKLDTVTDKEQITAKPTQQIPTAAEQLPSEQEATAAASLPPTQPEFTAEPLADPLVEIPTKPQAEPAAEPTTQQEDTEATLEPPVKPPIQPVPLEAEQTPTQPHIQPVPIEAEQPTTQPSPLPPEHDGATGLLDLTQLQPKEKMAMTGDEEIMNAVVPPSKAPPEAPATKQPVVPPDDPLVEENTEATQDSSLQMKGLITVANRELSAAPATTTAGTTTTTTEGGEKAPPKASAKTTGEDLEQCSQEEENNSKK